MATVIDCALDNMRENAYRFRFNLIGFLTRPRPLFYFQEGEQRSYWVPAWGNGTEFRSVFQDEYGRWVEGNEWRYATGSTYQKSDFVKV